MLSKRLKAIASLVPDNTKVFDVGCDHGLLSIYLSSNHEVVASDISPSSIKLTKENAIKCKNKQIDVVLSDGLDNLNISKKDTIIIAGMGTYTIIKILNKNIDKLSDTIILQSNNNIEILRKKMYKLGYYIDKEINIRDSNYYYSLMRFTHLKQKINRTYFLLGPNPDKEYKEFVLKRYTKMLKSIPNKYFIRILKIKMIINKIKRV